MTASSQAHAETTAPLGTDVEAARRRLVQLHGALVAEAHAANTPAVGRALEMADLYLFLALGYLGHTEELLPPLRG